MTNLNYYIYILYSIQSNKYYVGYSRDPWIRLEQHLSNSKDKFTGKALDWVIRTVFLVSCDESEAIRIERFIKQQKSRVLIEKMYNEEFGLTGVLSTLVRVPHVRD